MTDTISITAETEAHRITRIVSKSHGIPVSSAAARLLYEHRAGMFAENCVDCDFHEFLTECRVIARS